MSDAEATLRYQLARSVITIAGTVTVAVDPNKTESRMPTAEVALGVAGDPQWELEIDGRSWKEDRKLDLKLAADGRLASLSGTSTGVGAAVLEAGVRLVGAGVGLAAAVLGTLSENGKPEDDPFEAAYRAANPELAAYRASIRAAKTKLQEALVHAADNVATSGNRHTARAALQDVESALRLVRDEAALVEQQFAAWKATTFPARTEEYTFTLGIDELLRTPAQEPEPQPRITIERERLVASAGVLAAVAALNTLVVVVENAPPAPPDRPASGPGVWFRRPREVVLAVYELTDRYDAGATSYAFSLKRRLPVSILDSHSPLSYIGTDVGLFGKRGAALETDASGVVTRISNDETSAAGQFAADISKAPAQLVDALDQATKITGSLATLRAANASRRLDDLERQKKTLEAEIAVQGDVATRDQQVRLAQLKSEADTLATIKQLGGDLDLVSAADKARGATAETAAEARLP